MEKINLELNNVLLSIKINQLFANLHAVSTSDMCIHQHFVKTAESNLF